MRIRRKLENLTVFAFRRFLVKALLKRNGIRNVLFLFQYDLGKTTDQGESRVSSDECGQFVVIRNIGELKDYSFSARLSRGEIERFFENGSIVGCCIEDMRVVAYSWLHFGFDYTGETDSVLDGKYCLIGPSFVAKSYRGRALIRPIKELLFEIARRSGYGSVFSVVAFDNIRMIRSNHRVGFRLFRVLYDCGDGRITLGGAD